MTEPSVLDVFDRATCEDIAHLLWMRQLDVDQVPPALLAQLTSEKNSPAASGERMRRFLEHLVEHRVSHTRNDARMYEAMLPYCRSLGPTQMYALRGLLPRSANDGYEPIPATADLQFPRDHELKLHAQIGWHFLVGSCWDADGQEYGVELMFFGGAIFPPEQAALYGLRELENQMMELQLAISVAGGRHYQVQPTAAAGTSGLIQTSASPFSLALGRNLLQSQRERVLFPLHAHAWGLDKSEHPSIELEVDLVFASGKEYLAQGNAGAMPSVDGVGTLYYSIPNIQIDPSASRMRVGDREVTLVRGLFWLDHQWGLLGDSQSEVMRAAENIREPAPEGWDWFAAQFVGDRQLTMFAPHGREYVSEFYHQTGSSPPANMEVRVGGKFMSAAKETTTIWGTMKVTDWIKADRSPNPDRYPPTYTWHPNRWEFAFDELPEDLRFFTMVPIVNHAQSIFFASGAQISEGAVRLHDRAGDEIGRGFAESVGYADTRRNMLRLAGLPESAAMLELVMTKTPPLSTRLMNALYLLSHQKQLYDVLESAKGLEFFVDQSNDKPVRRRT